MRCVVICVVMNASLFASSGTSYYRHPTTLYTGSSSTSRPVVQTTYSRPTTTSTTYSQQTTSSVRPTATYTTRTAPVARTTQATSSSARQTVVAQPQQDDSWFGRILRGMSGSTELMVSGAIASKHLAKSIDDASASVTKASTQLREDAAAIAEGEEGTGGLAATLQQAAGLFQEGLDKSLAKGSGVVVDQFGQEVDRQRTDTLDRLESNVDKNIGVVDNRVEQTVNTTADTTLKTVTVGAGTVLATAQIADNRARETALLADKHMGDAQLHRVGETIDNANLALTTTTEAAQSADNAAKTVETSAKNVPIVLHSGLTGLNETLEKRSSELSAILQTSLKSLDENGNKLVESVDANGQRTIMAVDAQGNRMHEAIDQNGNLLFMQGEEVVFAIDQQGNNITSSIQTSGDDLSMSIEEAGAATSAAVIGGAALTDAQLRAQGKAARQQIAASTEARLLAASIVVLPTTKSIAEHLALFEPKAPLARFANDTLLREGLSLGVAEFNKVKSVQLAEMTDTQFEEYVLSKKRLKFDQFALTGLRLEMIKVLSEFDEGLHQLFLDDEETQSLKNLRAELAEDVQNSVQLHTASLTHDELEVMKAKISKDAAAVTAAATKRHTTTTDVISEIESDIESRIERGSKDIDAASAAAAGTATTAAMSLDEMQRKVEVESKRQADIALAREKLIQLKLDKEDLIIAVGKGTGAGERIKVRHILISLEKDGAEALANSLYDQLQENASFFPSLARTHSDDITTKNTGGVRNYFSRGTYDAGFETAAFAIGQKNKFAPVTKTSLGYQIIQLLDRQASVEATDIDEKVLAFNDRADALIIEFDRLQLLEDKQEAEDLKVAVQTAVDTKKPERSLVGTGSLY